jgi:hypothetical protein
MSDEREGRPRRRRNGAGHDAGSAEAGANGDAAGSGNGSGHAGPNGSAVHSGDVLPFRPRSLDELAGARPRRGRHLRRDARSAPAHEFADAADATDAPAGTEAPPLPQRVAALAARGLDEAEIRVRLGLPEALDARSERMLAEAFRHGQLLGRAAIKEAQFEAALGGRVTAQTQVLARLGEPQGEHGAEIEDGALESDGSPARPGES